MRARVVVGAAQEIGAALLAIALALGAGGAAAQSQEKASPQVIRAAVLRVDGPELEPITRLELPAEDRGFAGARLATEDNQTTGRFMNQTFETLEVAASPEEAMAALEELLAQGVGFIVTAAPADVTLALADAAKGRPALLFNAEARDDRLRGADCRANLLHTAPSRAMLTDGLAQYLVWKRWNEWLLIHGSNPEDQLLAESYRRSAAKFGAEIVEERMIEDTGGSRRTDTGFVLIQKQMPVLTQRVEDHDVVVAADESYVFADYLPYRTWEPRPVTGSGGLRPLSWHPAHEAWGARQMQRRFEKETGSRMTELDHQVWMAIRALGEAATRTGSDDFETLSAYIRGPEFGLAAFKGQALTFRDWNGQLRQPVLLGDGRVVVSVSPQEGFLHQTSLLDTLGFDRPETACRMN